MARARSQSNTKEFTPALGIGNAALTPLYDSALGLLTRENTWRGALVEHMSPVPSDRILDVRCGTGSLAVQIKRLCPDCEIHGIDPDKDILRRAETKANREAANITFDQEFLTCERAMGLGKFSVVV